MTSRALSAALVLLSGCSVWASPDERLDGGGADAGTDGGVDAGMRDGGTDASIDAGGDAGRPCPATPVVVAVTGDIAVDTTWTCANLYVLATEIHVTAGATLTIEAGTTVAANLEATLVVASGSTLLAMGTARSPVVFTSVAATRDDGDWAGVILLGDAPVHGGSRVFDEISRSEVFGGADDAHRCGVLRYVRIEFAGARRRGDRARLPALLLAGCGSETELDHVQIHMSNDDGIAFYGGSARAHHVVITKADDDAIEWQWGYSGSVQFAIVQQNDGSASSIKGENDADAPDTLPRSEPWLSNLTLVGRTDEPGRPNSRATTGMHLTDGTAGHLSNVIVLSHRLDGGGAIDVVSAETAAQAIAGDLTVDHIVAYDLASLGDTSDDDGGFLEEEHFAMSSFANRFDVDPLITGDPYSWLSPSFAPAASSPVATMGATPDVAHGLDPSATYVGAIEPGGSDWTRDWTSYARQ